jgi:hypothetical protein
MLKRIIILLLLLSVEIMFSQNQMRYGTISTAGGKVSSTNKIMIITVGESVTGKISGAANQSSMGFWSVYQSEVLTSVEDEETMPVEYKLYQNYPNPFNPATKIQYAVGNLPEGKASRQLVQLKVYDILGNELATLVNEEKPAGKYEIEFNATQLSSGVYFYKLQAGEFVETKKMILLR